MVAAFIFATFFGATTVAFVFHRGPIVRGGYLFFLLALISAPGFGIVAWHWPFFSWHLYATRTQPEITFSEVRVADAEGNEIKLSARGIPPTMATPMRRFGDKLLELEPEHAQELARFFLEKANERADRLRNENETFWRFLKFPRHQYGYRWSKEMLEGLGPFVELRVYTVDAEFSEDGRELLSRTEELTKAFS